MVHLYLYLHLATCLYLVQVYLTSLEAGGGGGGNTVFNQLGLSVPPARGAALLWHTVSTAHSAINNQHSTIGT